MLASGARRKSPGGYRPLVALTGRLPVVARPRWAWARRYQAGGRRRLGSAPSLVFAGVELATLAALGLISWPARSTGSTRLCVQCARAGR